jgi:hypothetical protein
LGELNLFRCVGCYQIVTVDPNKLDTHGNIMVLNLDNSIHSCSNLDVIDVDDIVTKNRLIDDLFLQMIRVRSMDPKNGVLKRKYEDQARFLLFRIPVYRPTPFFTLYYSDILDDKIKQELAAQNDTELDDVMRAVIGRVFECVNERQFNLSVRKLLRWRIEA